MGFESAEVTVSATICLLVQYLVPSAIDTVLARRGLYNRKHRQSGLSKLVLVRDWQHSALYCTTFTPTKPTNNVRMCYRKEPYNGIIINSTAAVVAIKFDEIVARRTL